MTEYPAVIDYAPLHIDAQGLRQIIAKYGDDPDLEKVAFAIASYANPRGVAWPGLDLLSTLTSLDKKIVGKKAHWLQSAGVLTIRRVKSKGAAHAHNVYTFVKKIVRKTADVTSAHFIGNLQKWKAAASDVAAAVKEKARAAVDTVVSQAGKLAAIFAEKPELMESPEKAAALAGIEEPTGLETAVEPVTVEIPAVAEPIPSEPVPAASTLSEPTPTQPVGDAIPSQPLPACYQRETSHVFTSWRDRVAAYREKSAVAD